MYQWVNGSIPVLQHNISFKCGQYPHAGPCQTCHESGCSEQSQQEQQHTPSLLSLLPTDLLGQVFERIPAATSVWGAVTVPSRLSARAACLWLRNAFDACNTHLVLVGEAAAGAESPAQRRSYYELLQRLIARTSCLNSLSISRWENSRELLKLPVPWGQLKKLDLSDLPFQNPYSTSGKAKLQAFGPLACCSALEELHIQGGSLYLSRPETLPFCSTLRSLCLFCPSNRDICSIAPLFTALQQMELKGSGDKLDFASIAACTALRQLSLKLSAFEGINDSMSSLTSLTQLTSLKMHECDDLEDLQAIGLLSTLRHLELEGAYSITDISPLGSLRSSLEHLVLTDGSFAMASLEPCLSSCTLLRHLKLGIRHYGDEDVIFNLSALSACVFLEYLNLEDSPVTCSLEPLLPCIRLQRLLLEKCPVTALAPLASLVELDLSFCVRLRDLSPLTACVSLSSLNVSRCSRVKSLAPLAACIQLEMLQLSNCAEVTSLEPIAACTKLAHLNLEGCYRIKSLVPLKACTALMWLNLNYLGKLMDLAPLAACPALVQLDMYGCSSSLDLAPLRSCLNLKICPASPM